MIRIEGLHYGVGNFALEDISLDVRPGEYFVLLGPSGSGKTVLLECLCGLNRVDSGRILIDGLDVTRLEPRNRGIGYLPQDYALFPNRTVASNIQYGLHTDWQCYGRAAIGLLTGLPRLGARTARRAASRLRLAAPAAPDRGVSDDVLALLDLVGARHLAARLPDKLSGGEKQRIALARALAVRPKLLLLDEPVSALDEQMRDRLCPELKQLQRGTRTTTIHVCHNFAEMMAVADRVGVIRQGRICQVGTPEEVLERPRTRDVAEFVQARNLFAARAEADGVRTRLLGPAGHVFHVAPRDQRPAASHVTLMIRPENIRLESQAVTDAPSGSTLLQGAVRSLTDSGPLVQFTVDCGSDFSLLASMGKREYNQRRVLCGDRVHLAVAPGDIHVLDD
jgi:ABC-type Fe3+/spermidine/putrescine transport system ATPase subunit